MQSNLDLNLLVALDALLEEGSVSGAALRLHLSTPAMSRTLGRIRHALSDPVLVRSGRAMVPTPRALEIRAEVHELVERAQTVFSSGGRIDLRSLERVFTLQVDEATVAIYAPPLLARVREQAPGVVLRFVGEGPGDSDALRQGTVDLQLGVVDDPAPEIMVEPLLSDRFLGVVRSGHPLLTGGPITAERFADADHLLVSRRGRLTGPIDALLAERGLRRRVVTTVPNFTASLFVLLAADLVGLLAERMFRAFAERTGLVTFPIPLELTPLEISQAWHRRYEADAAHAWLRRCVQEVFDNHPVPM